ncbi:MAG: hypothetical protein ACNA77_01505 [Opitutales bacterium]
MKLRYILLLLLSATALADDTFQKGLDAYHNAEYAASSQAFALSIEAGETAAAQHNRALALYREGKPGEAAWHLERAVLLDPKNESYQFKLAALRQQLGLPSARPEWYRLASQALSQRSWIILLSLAFWSTLAAFWLPRYSSRGPNLAIKALRLIGLIALLAAGAAHYLNRDLPNRGIVLAASAADLHAAPASAAPSTGLARPGERGRRIDHHKDYIQIETEGGARGWIAAESFRLVYE